MLNNHLTRKYFCLLLTLVIVSITGVIAQGAKEEKDKDAKEKTYVINEAELQSHFMSFADRFASILDMTIAKFENLNPQGKSRYEVLELMTFSLHQAFLIAAESDHQETRRRKQRHLQGHKQQAGRVLRDKQPKPTDRLGDQQVDRAAVDQIGEDAGGGDQRQDGGQPRHPDADAEGGEEPLVEHSRRDLLDGNLPDEDL